jgi:hypothetical protein
MISERQKKIYNSFLRASRLAKNKPYTQRQNFDNISPTIEVALKKLDNFFSSHKTVSYNDFFAAPYSIYTDTDFFELKFYITPRAVKCYTEYIKKQENADADSDVTIERCKACCSNIYNYCKENKITLQEYRERMCESIPLYIQHLKEHKINFYTIHGLDIPLTSAQEASDILRFMFDDFHTTFHSTRLKFIRSSRLKNVVRTAFSIIEDRLLIFGK